MYFFHTYRAQAADITVPSWQGALLYHLDKVHYCTILTRCITVPSWQGALLYHLDKVHYCTILTRCITVPSWQGALLYHLDKHPSWDMNLLLIGSIDRFCLCHLSTESFISNHGLKCNIFSHHSCVGPINWKSALVQGQIQTCSARGKSKSVLQAYAMQGGWGLGHVAPGNFELEKLNGGLLQSRTVLSSFVWSCEAMAFFSFLTFFVARQMNGTKQWCLLKSKVNVDH